MQAKQAKMVHMRVYGFGLASAVGSLQFTLGNFSKVCAREIKVSFFLLLLLRQVTFTLVFIVLRLRLRLPR